MTDERPRNKGGRPKGSRTRVPTPPIDHRRVVAYVLLDAGGHGAPPFGSQRSS